MNPSFEIKYLGIKWHNREILISVTESLGSLQLNYNNERSVFEAETSIYPRLQGIERGQLAIYFEEDCENPPYILKPDGENIFFSKIIDGNTNKTWWILQEKWNDEQKQWFGVAPNIAGTLRIIVKNHICEININGFDFSREELDNYLQGFKNDLWELILDEDSPVQGEAKNTLIIGVSEAVIDCISNLSSYASKIKENPKIELREIQTLKPRKSVKPVNRTFMELATKTNHQYLTSRASVPSYDVPENRYVLFALERCYRIIRQIVILAKNKRQRYRHTIDKLQTQYESFTDTIKINRDLVVADLEKIKQYTHLGYWQKKLEKELNNSNISFEEQPCENELFILLGNFTKTMGDNKPDGFFIQVWNGCEWRRIYDKISIFKPSYKFSELLNIIKPGMALKINCNYRFNESEKAVFLKIRDIHSIVLWNFTAIEKAQENFKKERAIGIELAKNNWIKKLSSKELEEQEKEKAALNNRIEFYIKNQEIADYVYAKVEPKLRVLKKIIQNFKFLKIRPSSQFPNSMTFVQNPNYQGVQNSYKILRDTTGLNDDELLMSLEEVDRIGLVNMPLLYERWVLLQLLLVLKESFRFIPQENWKYDLICAIKGKGRNIKISLLNKSAKRKIDFWCEKELPNGKRPDFIIDLLWRSNIDKLERKRFVLDAKFYDKSTFHRSGGMLAKINELYSEKNYSEDGENPVFLIHPCSNLIEEQKTAQDWGRHSFLGEIDFLDDSNFSCHDKGAIFLSPVGRASYNDELQRLLGLFLQYKLESKSVNENDLTNAMPICIRCGSSDILKIEKSSGYYNGNGRWVARTERSVWMQCNECKQMQIYNHCGSGSGCDTRIIKNGIYWSYHSARALEPFNMKCPSCGQWGAW